MRHPPRRDRGRNVLSQVHLRASFGPRKAGSPSQGLFYCASLTPRKKSGPGRGRPRPLVYALVPATTVMVVMAMPAEPQDQVGPAIVGSVIVAVPIVTTPTMDRSTAAQMAVPPTRRGPHHLDADIAQLRRCRHLRGLH